MFPASLGGEHLSLVGTLDRAIFFLWRKIEFTAFLKGVFTVSDAHDALHRRKE